MENIKILVVDDESRMRKLVKDFLVREGYTVLEAGDGMEAMDVFYEDKDIALIILDVMMPGMDGILATTKLREKSNIPVILLTAKSEDTDKVLGLTIGADDYVTKPFHPMEVVARVKSQLRRYTLLGSMPTEPQKPQVITIGSVMLDDESKLVEVDGEPVSLTPTEYSILKLLMSNAGQVFSTAQIYAAVWKEDAYGNDSTVAVHIRHLREKIEITPAEPRYVKVVWGQGYKFEKGGKTT